MEERYSSKRKQNKNNDSVFPLICDFLNHPVQLSAIHSENKATTKEKQQKEKIKMSMHSRVRKRKLLMCVCVCFVFFS